MEKCCEVRSQMGDEGVRNGSHMCPIWVLLKVHWVPGYSVELCHVPQCRLYARWWKLRRRFSIF
jgi:hypothetical protein